MSPATLAIQIDKNLIQALYLQKNEVNPLQTQGFFVFKGLF